MDFRYANTKHITGMKLRCSCPSFRGILNSRVPNSSLLFRKTVERLWQMKGSLIC